MKQNSYGHPMGHMGDGKSRQPTGNGNEMHHFVTDSEYHEENR